MRIIRQLPPDLKIKEFHYHFQVITSDFTRSYIVYFWQQADINTKGCNVQFGILQSTICRNRNKKLTVHMNSGGRAACKRSYFLCYLSHLPVIQVLFVWQLLKVSGYKPIGKIQLRQVGNAE